MNRDHVGMLFKFLPKEEQEEIRKLKPKELEFYSVATWNEASDEVAEPEDIDGEWTVCKSKFIVPHFAYRPKGFLSWTEMKEDFERLYLGKKIKFVGDGEEEEYTCKFTGKWLNEKIHRAQAEMKNENGTFDFFPEFYEDLPGYGFEVIS